MIFGGFAGGAGGGGGGARAADVLDSCRVWEGMLAATGTTAIAAAGRDWGTGPVEAAEGRA